MSRGTEPAARTAPSAYAWAVFALGFGLLISDYMARQVLNAVFPLLKAEWALSDAQLGLLSGVVAVMVGLLTFPLSLLADRWGRVKSLTLMAVLWSVATLICALAQNYPQILIGRILVGVGEAAYGSAGIAVVISVFPPRLRSTLAAAFMAGGLFGQVLGVAVGGQIAAAHGWRAAFLVIALSGLALAILYPIVVRERRVRQIAAELGGEAVDAALGDRPPLRMLFRSSTVRLTYLASGLQLYAASALAAWLPSYFVRYHHLALGAASRQAALLLLVCGIGMIVCGIVSDRLARGLPVRKATLAIGYCLVSALLLALALALPPGSSQLVVLGLAVFTVAGTTGPAGAMVANLTPRPIHGAAFATLTLANNFLGLAPGPILTGRLADSFGLLGALQFVPLVSLVAALLFLLARRRYAADLESALA